MSEVIFERSGPVGIVTLNAPERRNAFTAEMVKDLIDTCDRIDADETIGAVVLQARGDSFCSGAHREVLAESGKDPVSTLNYRRLGRTYQAFVRVGELQAPTIAAVRGHAVGAGVNLMLATDLRVVAHGARIMTGFLRISIHPGGGHFALLGRTVGRETASALSVFGQEIDGRRAAALGLAWESVEEAEVEPRALELATAAGLDPELARATVRSFRLELGPPAIPWAAALEVEKAVQMWSLRRREEKAPKGP